jgi:beta-lactam-binding protein with PASTA domain
MADADAQSADYIDEGEEEVNVAVVTSFWNRKNIILVAVMAVILVVTIIVIASSGGGSDNNDVRGGNYGSGDIADGYGIMRMPDLVGMDYDEAIATYPNLNFNAMQEYSSEYLRGQIIRQSVLAGRDIRVSQRIDVTVSMGAMLIELRDYESGEFHIDEVRARLIRQGFAEANISVIYEESTTVSAEYVIRTEPSAGSMIELDTRITVWVSMGGGIQATQVPDLVGLTRTQAEERARMYDIVLLIIEEYSDEVAEGRVIEQSISPMTEVEKHTFVEIVVSIGVRPSQTAEIRHEVSDRITGSYTFNYYIDGVLSHTATQNMSLNKTIHWEFEGTGVQTYAIEITSLDTGRTAVFVVYEVDFRGSEPVQRRVEMNDRVFTEIS